MTVEENKTVEVMKASKIFLNKDSTNKTENHITNKINYKNVAIFLKLSDLYKLCNVAKFAFNYIDGCLTFFAETKSFLNLEFKYVVKMLSSSNLNVTSEIEVFNIADNWITFNSEDRHVHAKDLLLKIRLPVLSDAALEYVLNKKSSFRQVEECLELINNTLEDKHSLFCKLTSLHFVHRHHDQFNILICGGYNRELEEYTKSIIHVDVEDIKNTKPLACWQGKTDIIETAVIKDSVIAFHVDEIWRLTELVEMYSLTTNTWSGVCETFDDNRQGFCICSFMNRVYIIGGHTEQYTGADTCLQFDPIDVTWKEVGSMNAERVYAACAVFEGRIVVGGGLWNGGSVEVYDHIADEWSYMPNMVEETSGCRFSLVSTGSKLFAVGEKMIETVLCEVFDSKSNIFVSLNSFALDCHLDTLYLSTALSIGTKLFIVYESKGETLCYDVETDKCFTNDFEVTKDLVAFSCVRVPKL